MAGYGREQRDPSRAPKCTGGGGWRRISRGESARAPSPPSPRGSAREESSTRGRKKGRAREVGERSRGKWETGNRGGGRAPHPTPSARPVRCPLPPGLPPPNSCVRPQPAVGAGVSEARAVGRAGRGAGWSGGAQVRQGGRPGGGA
jgi:hypothetical protein